MGVKRTTIAYLRVLIIEIGSTIILMVVEAQGIGSSMRCLLYLYTSLHGIRDGGNFPVLMYRQIDHIH